MYGTNKTYIYNRKDRRLNKKMIHPDLKQATINPRKKCLGELEAGEFFYNEDRHICVVLRPLESNTKRHSDIYIHNYTTGIHESVLHVPGKAYILAKITIVHEPVPVDEKETK